jgi:hypothetical protein
MHTNTRLRKCYSCRRHRLAPIDFTRCDFGILHKDKFTCDDCLIIVNQEHHRAACIWCANMVRERVTDLNIKPSSEHRCMACNKSLSDTPCVKPMRIAPVCLWCASNITSLCEARVDRFETLPNEVLCHIWSFIDMVSIIKIQRTCKLFTMISSDSDRIERERQALLTNPWLIKSPRIESMTFKDLSIHINECHTIRIDGNNRSHAYPMYSVTA